jgi:hypothetical protein
VRKRYGSNTVRHDPAYGRTVGSPYFQVWKIYTDEYGSARVLHTDAHIIEICPDKGVKHNTTQPRRSVSKITHAHWHKLVHCLRFVGPPCRYKCQASVQLTEPTKAERMIHNVGDCIYQHPPGTLSHRRIHSRSIRDNIGNASDAALTVSWDASVCGQGEALVTY